jgi:hypothetical protein
MQCQFSVSYITYLTTTCFGCQQVCVSPAKTVSLCAVFCHISILDVIFWNYLFIEIIKKFFKILVPCLCYHFMDVMCVIIAVRIVICALLYVLCVIIAVCIVVCALLYVLWRLVWCVEIISTTNCTVIQPTQ